MVVWKSWAYLIFREFLWVVRKSRLFFRDFIWTVFSRAHIVFASLSLKFSSWVVLILGVPFSFLEMFEETLLGVVRDVSATATALREQEFDSVDDLLQIPRADIWHVLATSCKLKAKTVQDIIAYLDSKRLVVAPAASRSNCWSFNSHGGCWRGANCAFAHERAAFAHERSASSSTLYRKRAATVTTRAETEISPLTTATRDCGVEVKRARPNARKRASRARNDGSHLMASILEAPDKEVSHVLGVAKAPGEVQNPGAAKAPGEVQAPVAAKAPVVVQVGVVQALMWPKPLEWQQPPAWSKPSVWPKPPAWSKPTAWSKPSVWSKPPAWSKPSVWSTPPARSKPPA